MKQEVLKIIDWPLSIKLANDRADIAEELFNMLIVELPIARKDINEAFNKKDYDQLHHHVHKLHGACCYCGVPQLKDSTRQLEIAATAQDSNAIKLAIDTFNSSTDAVLEEANSTFLKNR